MAQSVFQPRKPSISDSYPNPLDDRGLYDKAFANRDTNGLIPVGEGFHTEWLPDAAQMVERGEYRPDELTHDENVVLHEYMADRKRRINLGEPVTDGEASEYISWLMGNPKNLPHEDSQYEIALALAGNSGNLLTPDEYFDAALSNIRPRDRGTAWLNDYPWGEGLEPEEREYTINSPDYRLERVVGAFGPQLVSRRVSPKPVIRQSKIYSDPEAVPLPSLQEVAKYASGLLEFDPSYVKKHRLKAAGAALWAAGVTLKYGLMPNWMLNRKQSGSTETEAEPLTTDQEGINALIEITETQRRANETAAARGPAPARLLSRKPGEGRQEPAVPARPQYTWNPTAKTVPIERVVTGLPVMGGDDLASLANTAQQADQSDRARDDAAQAANAEMQMDHEQQPEADPLLLGLQFGEPETAAGARRNKRLRRISYAVGSAIFTSAAIGGPYFAFIRR